MRSHLHAPIYRGGSQYVGRPGMSPAIAALVALEALRPEHRILDVGCGRGDDLLGLARLGFRRLVGIDHNARSIRAARRRVGASAVDFRLGTLDDLPSLPAASFDRVLDTFLVNNLREDGVAEYLERVARRLPPGGLFFVHGKAGARAPEASGRGGLRSPHFDAGPVAMAAFAERDPDGGPSFATGYVQRLVRNARPTPRAA